MTSTWLGATEHGELLNIAERCLSELGGLQQRLEYRDGVAHMHHLDFTDRARGLASYLRAAALLAQADLYAPAFANLRTALEQMLVDHLVFLGRRYIQVIEGVDEDTWKEWHRQRSTGEAFATVVDWSRSRKGQVEITFEGLRSNSADGEVGQLLSIHYFLLKQYKPYLGPPGAQRQFDDGLSEPERDLKNARQNEVIYRTYLNWKSIKRSLQSNEFANEDVINKLEVHYRFLSAFVHPISNVTGILYGRNKADVATYDHYSSELVLLYSITFAIMELRHFGQMSQHKPVVGLRNWVATERFCERAWEQISYLWFPGHSPHAYDRIKEANRRAFRAFNSSRDYPPFEDPFRIPKGEIGYYRDPIRRLVELHAGFHEITTGLAFVSPWPRGDAQLR